MILFKELSAGVAQLGQSVRLIIERPRAQVPPPAYKCIGSLVHPQRAVRVEF